MRRLMWFAIGYAAACAVGVYLLSGIWLLILGLVCLGSFFGVLFARSMNDRRAACGLLGCAISFVWLWCFDLFYLTPVRQMDGQTETLAIEVTDYSSTTEYGIKAEGKILLAGKRYSIQFYLNEGVDLSPGDKVEGSFRLRYTGGGAQNPTFHRGNGVFLLGYPEEKADITFAQTVPSKYFVPMLRRQILLRLDALFPEDTQAFAGALLLGETNDLSYGIRSALKVSGIYHVAAVSGMHVSILFSLVYLFCGKQRGFTALLGLPLLVLFTAVAGFTPSIVRACIMQVLMILALLVNKEYDPPTALAAAGVVILAVNPISITSVSLQLSAGCMAGIFLFSQRVHQYLLAKTRLGPAKGKGLKARLVRGTVSSVSMTIGAMLLTTPLSAVYFGNISLMGILTNLLTLWLISLIFYGIMAACVLAVVWLPLGSAVGWLTSWPIRIVLWVSDMISNIPVSAVYTSSIYIIAWLLFCYVLLTVFIKSKKKHPVVLVCCLLVGLVGAVACSWAEPKLDNYRITAVDVGQGQCLILQSQGEYYVVDCGGDSGDTAAERATQLLFSQGVFHLDGLILTHYDADHAGGALQLLDRVRTDTVFLPVLDGENEIRDQVSREHKEKVHWVEDTLMIQLPNGSLTIYPSAVTNDDNESSLCILFQPENCDILITGDRSEVGELELLETADLPDLEILVAGHHGSRTSTSWRLLDETRPEIVIISVGEDNSYGHPNWETLERLSLFGCSVYRTDTEGTIIFRG